MAFIQEMGPTEQKEAFWQLGKEPKRDFMIQKGKGNFEEITMEQRELMRKYE